MSSVSFSIPYVCGPKQSDRNKGRQHYPDPKVKADAQSLASLVAPHRPDKPLQGPLGLSLTVRYPWRKTEKKKWVRLGKRWKSSRPDYDNLSKQIGDVLERTGFMANDAQIACGHIEKFWTEQGGMDISLDELEPNHA